MGRLPKPKQTGYEQYLDRTVRILTEGYKVEGLNRTCDFLVTDVSNPTYLGVCHLNGIRDMILYENIVSLEVL